MKRALAGLALVAAAACSSGGETGQERVAETTTTPTTVAPAEAFKQRLDSAIDGMDQEAHRYALDLAEVMCDLLESTDNDVTDDAASAQLTTEALDMVAERGDPGSVGVTAVVMHYGAEYLCPDYSDVVDDYTSRMG